MDAEQLKEDVLTGEITLELLIELLVTSQRELQAARDRIAELEGAADGARAAGYSSSLCSSHICS